MERSYTTMVIAIVLNFTASVIYFWFISEHHHNDDGAGVFLEPLHAFCWWLALLLFIISLTFFIMIVTLNPGFIEPFYDFTKLVEVALDIGMHLDNFCSYCLIIKSETSFHCNICNKCVELFDHHCPYINGCLGYRNHKYFLLFLFCFIGYLLVILVDTMRHFSEILIEEGLESIYTDSLTIVSVILITLHLPVMIF